MEKLNIPQKLIKLVHMSLENTLPTINIALQHIARTDFKKKQDDREV